MSDLLPVHDEKRAPPPAPLPRRRVQLRPWSATLTMLLLVLSMLSIPTLLVTLPRDKVVQQFAQIFPFGGRAPCRHRLYPSDPLARAKALLKDHPLIDGHIDVPVYARYRYGNKLDTIPFDQPALPNGTYPTLGHVDIPRLRKGHAGGFFWSAYVPCPSEDAVAGASRHVSDAAVRDTLEQFDVIRQMVDRFSDDFELVSTAESAIEAFNKGKLISFIGLEGGHSLGNSLFALRAYASLFARDGKIGPLRYLTLTHTCHNVFADSSGQEPPRWNGVSPFGIHLIQELNRLGIVPDLSHVSDDTAAQVIGLSLGPVMLSHSSARALNDVPRNAPDWVLWQLAHAWNIDNKDNIVMINVYPDFIGGSKDLEQVVRHVEHVASIVGKEHVGIGTDFDGIGSVPRGFEDVTKYPELVARLIEKGWTDEEVVGFVGGNVLRVLAAAERVAKRMHERGNRPDYTSWEDIQKEIEKA
ncbi:hypothetical protein ACQY0O_006620 [Thecaphora frezii]